MANFGGSEGADSDLTGDTENDMELLGVVTGTVSNIRAGGMDVDGSLMLGRATITTDTANGASDDGFMGDTSGTLAGRAMVGEWGGQFFGPSTASGTAAETQFPTTANLVLSARPPRAMSMTRSESSAPSARGKPIKRIDSAFGHKAYPGLLCSPG